ncbi:MAG TPA: hypothetical protein VNB94_03110 [Mycobacteriales bacterium]|nr:hypothetical protein [Mycobacteriales bacterium]
MNDHILTALAAARQADFFTVAGHARVGAAAAAAAPARPRRHLISWPAASWPQRRPAAAPCLSC